MFKNAFANLQKVGKSLMLPVSVLPIAGILLGVGSANFSWLPAVVSHVMACLLYTSRYWTPISSVCRQPAKNYASRLTTG